MKALLLAAGLGNRLKPITNQIPKCLVPIHGRPLLGIWLDNLWKHGVKQFLVNTHYMPSKVNEFLNSTKFKDEIRVVHEPKLLGTAGTVWENRSWITEGGPFFLIHADNLSICNFTEFIRHHENRPANVCMSMMTFKTKNPQSCGIVRLRGDHIVEEMYEKVENPPGNIANGAVYIAEPSMISSKFENADFSKDIIPSMMGRIQAWHNTVFHEDIGTIESYKYCNESNEVSGLLEKN